MRTTPISNFAATTCGLLAVLCFWLVPVASRFGTSLAGLFGAILACALLGLVGGNLMMRVPPVGRGLVVFGMVAALIASYQTLN